MDRETEIKKIKQYYKNNKYVDHIVYRDYYVIIVLKESLRNPEEQEEDIRVASIKDVDLYLKKEEENKIKEADILKRYEIERQIEINKRNAKLI